LHHLLYVRVARTHEPNSDDVGSTHRREMEGCILECREKDMSYRSQRVHGTCETIL